MPRIARYGLQILMMAGLGWARMLAVQAQTEAAELILEQGVNDYAGTRDTTIYQKRADNNGDGHDLRAGETFRSYARRALRFHALENADVEDGKRPRLVIRYRSPQEE